MQTVGIITFHGSHNHGSVLQAYATQCVVEKLGYSPEIIHFRMPSQKEYYALYQTKYGAMRFFRGLSLLPFHVPRMKREAKFEKFIHTRYKLSGPELHSYRDLQSVAAKYDIYLSGSDQIWSPRIPEFVMSETDYTGVYFLDFVHSTKKISYASSVGEATYDELLIRKRDLMEYAHISTREERGSEIIERIVGGSVKTVIDPTLLLTKNDWKKLCGPRLIKGHYLFLYTLQGIRNGAGWIRELRYVSKKLGLPIVACSPFVPVIGPGIKSVINVGPEDFINLIMYADLVFTDSFHGTAFSVNFNRPFFSLTKETGTDVRKKSLLAGVRLERRGITDYRQIHRLTHFTADFSEANKRLECLRKDSLDYLKRALEE